MQVSGEHPALTFRCTHNRRTSAVPEQNTGVAIRPIRDRRHHFRPYDQNMPHTGSNIGIGHTKRVDESAAGGRHITSRCAGRSQPVLEQAGGGR